MLYLRHFILFPLALFLVVAPAFAQMAYDPGDWITYRDFRWARAVDAGPREVFIATSGGILEYDLYRQSWRSPMAFGYATSEAIELDDPILLLYDDQTGYLWVATRTQFLQYDTNAERWKRVHSDLWGSQQRVVNIGVGGDELYVELLPASLYDRLFLVGSPLPLGDWQGFATRYRGSRTFGSLMPDINPELDENAVYWRGLRSKRPLGTEELFGNLGLPPANFPSLLMPGGWTWQSDGMLLDPSLRPYPVTDWVVDRFGNLWATFWGAGVLKGDLRSGRVQIHNPGPAGNDIRALLVREDFWMGGLNRDAGQGITHASGDLKIWQHVETRDNSRIRSTELFDIASWDGSVWFATDEGLLEFKEREGQWKAYTVGEDLQSNHIRALAATDSALWIGNASGLAVITPDRRKAWRVPVPQVGLTEVIELAVCQDTLYVSTVVGLYKCERNEREFVTMYTDPGLLNAPVVDSFVEGSVIWFATPEGIQYYDQATGEMKAWHASDWMSDAIPTAITRSGPFVWVGTRSNGFYRFEVEQGRWLQYTTADGLVDNRVQVLRADGDDLFIGTAGGLTNFYWNRPGRPR